MRTLSEKICRAAAVLLLLIFGTVQHRATPAADSENGSQVQFAAVLVNGRRLTGPNTAAQRRGGRMLVPVAAIAKALGDTAVIDVTNRTAVIRRQDGVTAELDARLGQVRENGTLVLSVTASSDIVFGVDPEAFLLPVEIASALFEASIRYDVDKNIVTVTRGLTASLPTAGTPGRRPVDLYQLDYEYDLNRYSTGGSQDVVLTGSGRIGDGRFYFTSNSGGNSVRRLTPRHASFSLERPNGQRFFAGDLGAGTELQFLSANVRGGSASIPVGDLRITAFGGRTFSGSVAEPLIAETEELRSPAVRDRFDFDTTIFGAFATRSLRSRSGGQQPITLSAGAMHFANSYRSGDLASAAATYGSGRLNLRADIGIGRFSQRKSEGQAATSLAAGVDIAGTFQFTDNISVQGRYAHLGENFLAPQNGSREPIDLRAAGVSWSPTKWLSASFNLSSSRRPGSSAQDNSYATAAFSITPATGLPRIYFAHTQSSTALAPKSAFTILNAAQDFRRMRLYLSATRIKMIGAASLNVQAGAAFSINDRHSIEASQSIGRRGAYNGQFDWRASGLFRNKVSLIAGLGYSRSASSGFSPYERLAVSVVLPRQTSLQVNYYQTTQGPAAMISLKGNLFKKREAQAFLASPAAEMNSYGKLSGRVYQDVDLNGRFDEGVDKPQADVKVRVDGNRYVLTDANGLYDFASVMSGDHNVYLDLLSVRADLTILDEASQHSRLLPGASANHDFRLVRTGRIRGRVWHDANENGRFDDGETPLADVRIVTSGGKDTLTDADGFFVLGDLPPGEYVITIDEKTLPEKTIAGTKPLAVRVFPGRETTGVEMSSIERPAEIKRFASKAN